LIDTPNAFKFKGFLLGNPFSNDEENIYGMMATFAGHSLIPQQTFKNWSKYCLKDIDESKCDDSTNEIYNITSDI